MTLYITDRAEEFRIEISGQFMGAAVTEAAMAWEAALLTNVPRRISVDITRISEYDHAGYMLLREMHGHGTHIVAGTPKSLKFLQQITSPLSRSPGTLLKGDRTPVFEQSLPTAMNDSRKTKNSAGERVTSINSRAIASGE